MQRVYFYTFGCKVNISEMEQLRLQAIRKGLLCVDRLDDADIVIINSCAVTQNAEKKCKDFIKKVKKIYDKKVVVTGCFASIIDNESKQYVDLVVENTEKLQILDKIAYYLDFEFSVSFENYSIKSDYDKTRAFLKIQDGCDSFCSYCIIPYLRGQPNSKQVEDVLKELNFLVDQNFKEIVLVGIHIGKYGQDIGIDLKYLLKRIIMEIDNGVRIRLSSLDVGEVDDELIDIVRNSDGKICNHFHISLQSGSDKILNKMNRNYSKEDFIKVCKKIKENISDVRIGSDVIVGFPGETDEDFNSTIDTLVKGGVDFLHVFSYSKRKGTKAYNMDNHIPKKVKEQRAKRLREVGKILKREAELNMVGKIVNVLIESNGGGYTSNYHYVTIEDGKVIKNELCNVLIKNVNDKGLVGVKVE
ncbi:tRNA (N(6)-L-threonylcarbamoyladenosine(37)-C(2))-methylthiotransferase MtaB [Deferribacter abyssi]|uniref:tRNA (N(6)-L-threonylcarbamoyladenosine(37)-C(2))- methylthiotransferase MtaB n=1 Tax=Deferribacter abyssi TaxID=213806 RepID=UPI003C26C952